MSSTPKTNLSLKKKTAARIAAVQCIYSRSFSDNQYVPSVQVTALKERLHQNKEEQKLVVRMAVEPSYQLVETLVIGVGSEEEEINWRLDSILNEQWQRNRMNPVMVAVLQCAIYEMFFGKPIKPSIVIDEYTSIAASFFDDKEVNFVHGALSTLSQQYG